MLTAFFLKSFLCNTNTKDTGLPLAPVVVAISEAMAFPAQPLGAFPGGATFPPATVPGAATGSKNWKKNMHRSS